MNINQFLLNLLLFLTACSTPIIRNDAKIKFNENNFDFGVLEFKKEATYSFKFSNPGKIPLVINNVKASCGCTIPEWSQNPLKPGLYGEIKIKYDASSPGIFSNTIKVYYNGADSPVILKIRGKVDYPNSI